MSIRRKPPPNILQENQFQTDVDNYINKSPYTAKFRIDNPNLQDISDSSLHIFNSTDSNENETFSSVPTDSNIGLDTKNELKFKSDGIPDSIRKRIKRLSLTNTNSYSIAPATSLNSPPNITSFWKYHILRFGKDLYLSTNPDFEHVYCRNGPGYYVDIEYLDNGDFVMIFKLLESIESNKPPVLVIQKMQDNFLIHNVGEVIKKPIIHQSIELINYEFQFEDQTWNIGSLPRTKERKLNKLRSKLNNDYNDLKYVSKNNLYFYNKKDISQDLSDLTNICGFLRPQENRFKKKLLRLVRNINHPSGAFQNDSDLSVGTKTHKFYSAGDGLSQSNPTPQDDKPNEHKLGWITIYENMYFGDHREHSQLFIIILGITLAIQIGIENQLEASETIETD